MFKFVDRQKERFLVIMGGWAFDYRIFTGLDLPFNYIFSDDPQNGLKKHLKEKGDKETEFYYIGHRHQC